MSAADATGGNGLPVLAREIEAAHQAAYGAARTALEHAAECGRLLIEAKAAVGHGGWLPWLQANTSVGVRQCQRYMQLAKGWAEIEGKCDADSHLTLTGAVSLLADPKDSSEAIYEYLGGLGDDEDSLRQQLNAFLGKVGVGDPLPTDASWVIVGVAPRSHQDHLTDTIVEIAPAPGGHVYLTVLRDNVVSGAARL